MQGGRVTFREARREVEQRPPELTQRIHALGQALLLAAARKHDQHCVVCGLASDENQPHFVLPVGYIATILVINDLDEDAFRLPLKHGFLCTQHDHHFSCLFADLGDASLDLDRLERRTRTLDAVQRGQLLVFGGPKALRLVEAFHTSVQELPRTRVLRKTTAD